MSQPIEVLSPWDGSLVGRVPISSPAEVDAALTTLERGRAVFTDLPAHERAVILHRLGDLLDEHSESLARLITREMGKTIRDARVEMARAANTARAAGDEARRMHGEILDSDAYPPIRGRWGLVHRRPLGIVLAITPFNFPVNLAVHKLGPAFAVGCPVLFKPGPQTALSGLRPVSYTHLTLPTILRV